MFYIDNQNVETIGFQIRSQLLIMLEKGILKSNDRLPSIKSLAYSLGINPMKIKKAYEKLIKSGAIYQKNNNEYYISNKANTMHLEDDLLMDFNHQVQIMHNHQIPKIKLRQVVNIHYKEE